jgi:lysostaphin
LKRALKKREKAVLKNTLNNDDAPVEHLEQPNVVNPRVNRRVGTQAAMIGLAISMGTTSLLITRQSDQAQGAAPLGSQKATSTIPAGSNTTVKFAPTKLTENPVILQPTAISQLPELETKWQVPVSGVQSDTKGSEKTSFNSQLPVSQELSGGITAHETVPEMSSTVTTPTEEATVNLTGEQQPKVLENPEANGEMNAQLKAQQTFAISRLQEKSNRLRNSLAELRSEETQISSKTDIASTQPKTTEKGAEIGSKTANDKDENLVSRFKQQSDSNPEAITIPVPAAREVVGLSGNGSYQVKPGDTLAAIALRHNISISEIVQANNLSNPDQLKVNQQLIIPITQGNGSRAISIPVVVAANRAYSSSTPQLNNYTTNNAGIQVSLPAASSQLPVTANNQIQVKTATTIETESINANTQGLGGDTAVPTIFAEMQQAQKSAEQTVGTKNNQGLRSLRADIQRLREKFNNQESANEPEPTAAPITVAQTNSLQAEIKKLQEKYRNQESGNAVVPVATKPEPEATVPSPIAQINSPEAEIQRLREQYRQQKYGDAIKPATNEAEKAPIAIPVVKPNLASASQPTGVRNNRSIPIDVPRLNLPNYGSQSANSQTRTFSTNEPINPEFFSNRNRSGQEIAASSSDAGISDTLGNLRGTRVTPQLRQQLPPLAAVQQYLPQPIDATTPPPATASTSYIWPAKGVLTSGYGRRWGRMHRGIDIANATGTPIYAAADGVVEKSGWNRGGYGILVDIRHDDGSLSRYAHNSRTLVRAGERVTQGQQIAHMGSTGFSTGPHTHFEIHPPGKGAKDPIAFLPRERN